MAQPGRTVAQVKDPFADVPAFDPTRLASENPPPPPAAPSDPPSEDERVVAAKQKYLASIEALAAATTPKEMHEQAIEIQRRRVVWVLTREAVEGVSDPDVLKELNVLSKLIGGPKTGADGFDDGDDTPERLLEQSSAEDLLKSRGVSPEAAGRLIRVLASLNGAGGTGSGSDNDTKFASAFRGPTGTHPGPAGTAEGRRNPAH